MNKYKAAALYKKQVNEAMARVSQWEFQASMKKDRIVKPTARLIAQRKEHARIIERLEISEFDWFDAERAFGRSRGAIRKILVAPSNNRRDLVIKTNRIHVDRYGQPAKGQKMEVV